MAGQIGEIPGDRRIGLSEQLGAIDQRNIIEFRAAYPLRLQDPEQASIVQIPLSFRRQAPQFLGPRRAIAQLRHECLGPGDHRRIGTPFRIELPCYPLWLAFDQRPPSGTRLLRNQLSNFAIIYRATAIKRDLVARQSNSTAERKWAWTESLECPIQAAQQLSASSTS